MKKEAKSIALADTRRVRSRLTIISIISRRSLLIGAVFVLAISSLQHGPDRAGAQARNVSERFTDAPITGKVSPKIAPRGASRGDLQEESTVLLKMLGDPVARVRARAPGKRIAENQRNSISQELRARQDVLAPQVEARGGEVLARFQHAVNGIKIRATPEAISEIAKLPGVVKVMPIGVYTRQTSSSVPFIEAPATWQGPPNLRGENIRIAIIDSGIDHTHANYGGPGTVAAYNAARAASTLPADPAMFGPDAPKVKGGTDLVGDDYDSASSDPARRVPHPDPNPLDCDGHGTLVAGIAAGFGVTSAGTTFTGPYDSSTPGTAFRIGPGVAPRADLYDVRVFGCDGSTDVVTEALDWAVQNDMQVVNLSLGQVFAAFTSDMEAADNAVDAGIVVVAVAGNERSVPYITHSPGAAAKVISVAAMDSTTSLPSVSLALNNAGSITAQNSNEAAIVNGTVLPVVVLRDSSGEISLGCDESEYVDFQIAGKLVVTRRGICDRVLRLFYATNHGAAAIAMINDMDGYPPLEGRWAEPYTIPFLGVHPVDAASLAGAASVTLSDTAAQPIPNPGFRSLAPFSSAGPRARDGRLKPDITAPGVRVMSSAVGLGTFGSAQNGTSLATPHVAGVAALVIQAHPTWNADQIATAIVNTGSPSQITDYAPRRAGSGLVQTLAATRTSVIATDDRGAPSASFGVEEFSSNFTGVQKVTIRNLGTQRGTFSVSTTKDSSSSPHSVNVFPKNISAAAGQTAEVFVTLSVSAATAGGASAFRDVAGFIKLTPTTTASNQGIALTVPYYLVPRARSQVRTTLQRERARIFNSSLLLPGTADFFAWGLSGEDQGQGAVDIRAVGVQSFDWIEGKLIVFAVNTFRPWSNASAYEYNFGLDVNEDGDYDYFVFAFDFGRFVTGRYDGRTASIVYNVSADEYSIRFLTHTATDSNTMLVPVLASDVGVTLANPRFSYDARGAYNFGPEFCRIDAWAKFNAFENAISTGAYVSVAPLTHQNVPISINPAEWQLTPAKGLMVVSTNNFTSGLFPQAELLPVPTNP